MGITSWLDGLSDDSRRVLRNLSWAVAGKSVDILCGLLVGVFVARHLGPSDFGLVGYVASYVTLFATLAAFGLDPIEIRELAQETTPRETILGTALALRLALAALAFAAVAAATPRLERDPFAAGMIMLYAATLFFNAVAVVRNYFTAIVRNEPVVKTEMARTLLLAGVKVGLLLAGAPVAWFIASALLDAAVIAAGLLSAYARHAGRIRDWRFSAAVARRLLRESFPLLLSSVAVVLYQQIDTVMIRNMLDTRQVGLYSIALKLTELVCFIPLVVNQSLSPLLARTYARDPGRYEEEKRRFVDAVLWSAIALAALLFAAAGPAVRLLYGPQYLEAIPVLRIMGWKVVLVALFATSGQIIVIEGRQLYAILRNLIGAAASVALNWVLIARYGIAGSAAAILLVLLLSGYLSSLLIPPYRGIFRLQTASLLVGWRRLAARLSAHRIGAGR